MYMKKKSMKVRDKEEGRKGGKKNVESRAGPGVNMCVFNFPFQCLSTGGLEEQ